MRLCCYHARKSVFFAPWGTLTFSYIRMLGPFLGFKILKFNILGVFRKMNIFGGYEDFVDIVLGSSQN